MSKTRARPRARRGLAASSHSAKMNRYIKFSLKLDELRRQLSPSERAEAQRRLTRERRVLRALRNT